MGMVAPQQRIASAFVVFHGGYGAVCHYAQQRGVCRQWVYREAAWVQEALTAKQQELQQLRAQVRQLQQRQAELEQRLARAVVIDEDKQAALATLGQARGVTLRDCQALLEMLIPGQVLSVATLGRRTQAAAQRAGALLAVLDEVARERVCEAAADEIYVKDPVLMVVEPESLCWIAGRLSTEASGEAWRREFEVFPKLEQVMCDAGAGLAKGAGLVNEKRRAQGQPEVIEQGDHYHALRGGGLGLRKAERQAREAFAEAEVAEKELAQSTRNGQKRTGPAVRASFAWKKAEQAMDTWQTQQRLWQATKDALQLFTPSGELNTRARAEGVLAETLAQLPDTFAKSKRLLLKSEVLNFLDRVQAKIAALPFPAELTQAAVRQEGLRRRPEALHGNDRQAGALRGVLLVCAVVLSKAGEEGQRVATQIRDIIRRAYRASSLVECINSVLRMQQAGHRRMTQGLIDLKRLYWNSHRFGGGRRRNTTPYQRLGITWPEDLNWWNLLKLTPEQLRAKLSTVLKPT